jgi:hypothetical protein
MTGARKGAPTHDRSTGPRQGAYENRAWLTLPNGSDEPALFLVIRGPKPKLAVSVETGLTFASRQIVSIAVSLLWTACVVLLQSNQFAKPKLPLLWATVTTVSTIPILSGEGYAGRESVHSHGKVGPRIAADAPGCDDFMNFGAAARAIYDQVASPTRHECRAGDRLRRECP